jgi:putative peptide zinc metalloprotease protein
VPASSSTEASSGPPASGGGPREAPRHADGLDLLGPYASSGYRRPPCLVRRVDGQVLQLTRLLYDVLASVDGRRDLEAVATEVTRRQGRTVTADNVAFLLDQKLLPLGLVCEPDGAQPSVSKARPLLRLRPKIEVVDERWTNRITAPFARLFHPVVVAVVLACFLTVTTWLFVVRGVAQATRELFGSPGLFVTVFVLGVLSAGFHEFGHAAACRYGGGRPAAMGAGIYVVWPAFYTDVTDSYRLSRAGRLRTDLGGLYFNAIAVLAAFAGWWLTGWEPLLILVPVQVLQMINQLQPFLRMDGYLILADLTGVPDLFARIKPTLQSALPWRWRRPDPPAAALKPWVRVVVTGWVLLVVPMLVASLVFAVVALPQLATTTVDAVSRQGRAVGTAVAAGQPASVTAAALSVVALLLPMASLLVMLARTARRLGGTVWTAAGRVRPGRPLLLVTAALLVGTLAWFWWPRGQYQPIRPTDRGTVSDAAHHVARAVVRNRPSVPGPHPSRGTGKDAGRSASTSPAPSQSPTPTPPTSTTTSPTMSPTTSPTTQSPTSEASEAGASESPIAPSATSTGTPPGTTSPGGTPTAAL